MSEIRRAAIHTAPRGHKEKGSPARSVRLSLELSASNEDQYPEINYRDLVSAHLKSKSVQKAKNGDPENGKKPPGVDPFSDGDDDVARIASQFEKKYGGQSTYARTKRTKRSIDEFADIGAGYDENDSFIDNTDGYDEMCPPGYDTIHGGFYVNCGLLEFKNVQDAESEPEINGPQRNKRRISSSTESESCSDSSSESSCKERALNGDDKDERRKQKKVDSKKKSKKLRTEASSAATSGKHTSDDQVNSADSRTSHTEDSLTSKPAPSSENVITSDSSRDVVEPAKAEVKLPPLVSALLDEMSTRVGKLKLDNPTITQTEMERHTDHLVLRLEQALGACSAEVRCRRAAWAAAARVLSAPRTKLLHRARDLARQCRSHVPVNTAAHTSVIVNPTRVPEVKPKDSPPDSTGTSAERTQLTPEEKETQINSILDRLKTIIEAARPNMIKNYKAECERIQEENKKIAAVNALSTDSANRLSERRLPKRRYPWCGRARQLLAGLVRLHEDAGEEAAAKVLAQRVLPLFPQGFVRLPTLLRQANLNKDLKVTEVKKQRIPTPGHIVDESRLPPNVQPVNQQVSSSKPTDKTHEVACGTTNDVKINGKLPKSQETQKPKPQEQRPKTHEPHEQQRTKPQDPQRPKTQEPQRPKIQEPQRPKTLEPQEQQRPKPQDPQRPKIQEPQRPKIQEPQKQKAQEQQPKPREQQRPKANEPQKPKQDNSQKSTFNSIFSSFTLSTGTEMFLDKPKSDSDEHKNVVTIERIDTAVINTEKVPTVIEGEKFIPPNSIGSITITPVTQSQKIDPRHQASKLCNNTVTVSAKGPTEAKIRVKSPAEIMKAANVITNDDKPQKKDQKLSNTQANSQDKSGQPILKKGEVKIQEPKMNTRPQEQKISNSNQIKPHEKSQLINPLCNQIKQLEKLNPQSSKMQSNQIKPPDKLLLLNAQLNKAQEKRSPSPLQIDTSHKPTPKTHSPKVRQSNGEKKTESNLPRPGLIPVQHSPTFAKPADKRAEQKQKDLFVVSDIDPLSDVLQVDDSSSDVELIEETATNVDLTEPEKNPRLDKKPEEPTRTAQTTKDSHSRKEDSHSRKDCSSNTEDRSKKDRSSEKKDSLKEDNHKHKSQKRDHSASRSNHCGPSEKIHKTDSQVERKDSDKHSEHRHDSSHSRSNREKDRGDTQSHSSHKHEKDSSHGERGDTQSSDRLERPKDDRDRAQKEDGSVERKLEKQMSIVAGEADFEKVMRDLRDLQNSQEPRYSDSYSSSSLNG